MVGGVGKRFGEGGGEWFVGVGSGERWAGKGWKKRVWCEFLNGCGGGVVK